jgi:thiosulfate/3-mercaptopyruvate sulfurtransferase
MKSNFLVRYAALVTFALSLCAAPNLTAQFAGVPSPSSAASVPTTQLIQPAELAHILQQKDAAKPLMFQVGSRVMYAQAHIPGSEYIGPGSQPAGLDLLKTRVARLDHKSNIVLYCGCCPWNRCPNVGPAYKLLTDLGFTHVRVLYFASNFGTDWAAKGYPVEEGGR